MANLRAADAAALVKGAIAIMCVCHPTHAAAAPADEMLSANAWVAVALEGRSAPGPDGPGIDVVRNWGRVQKNARYGRPLTIAGTRHARGLFCHGPTRITVRLPGPGARFEATIGLDDALQWDVRDYPSGPIWPEAVCRVLAGERTLFTSEVIKVGQPGRAVRVDLEGASEVTLEVGGARRSAPALEYLMTEEQKEAAKKETAPEVTDWTEVDWADASFALQDGRRVFLDDLPMAGSLAVPAAGDAPFSFEYGGRPSAALLKGWRVERTAERLDDARTRLTISYTDPRTGLVARCVAVRYADFPVVEWTLFLRNTGARPTPILRNIMALDTRFQRGPDSEFVLHHSLGSSCRADDYRPIDTTLQPRATMRFAPVTGYSSDPHMPYFNVDGGAGEGVIVAVGWPGQWSAEFARDDREGLRIRAGQETTRLRLLPGEEIRTPLIVLQFWQGDYARSQNTWRRWFVAHNLPRPGGSPFEPILAAGNWSPFAYTGMTEQNQKEFMDRYSEERIPINWWWIDFGWFEGTWQPARDRFPNGLRPVTDHGRKHGLKTLLWFAPEHSPFGADPAWLLKATADEPLTRGGEISALDLGNPAALKWMVETVDDVIVKGNLDCYRHDTSWGPLPTWRKRDTRDRQGITEIRYVEGFLAFYDELLRRHPNLMIDNCCRGGRRNDLETMRRSVPLWRSDYATDPVSQQCQSYGLALWLPIFGIGMAETDAYGFRSFMCPSTHILHDMRKRDLDYETMRKLTNEWREVAKAYLGDYHPLTPYSTERGEWMAWQYDLPAAGEGFVQVFRRAGDPDRSARAEAVSFRLRGLDPTARYAVRDFDAEGTVEMSGGELAEKGIQVRATAGPAAWLFAYRKAAR